MDRIEALIEKAFSDPIEFRPTGWRESEPALRMPNAAEAKARILSALSEQGEAAQPAVDGWEPDIEYEIWQADAYMAGSSALADAKHYAAVYSQDGPVQLVKATTYREPISPRIASQAEGEDGE